MSGRAFVISCAVVVAIGVVAVGACGGSGSGADDVIASPPGLAADASADRSVAAPHVTPDASMDATTAPDVLVEAAPPDASACDVRLASPPIMETVHVPEGSVVVYNSNPPSSGPHYATWANFQEYATPVDDRYLVHDLEHGAILFLYKCVDPDCAPLVAALRAVRDALPADPLCDPAIRVRIVIAPRPDNDVAVAASAWGATYRADCVDAASLTQFVMDHYAKGPENFCDPGQPF